MQGSWVSYRIIILVQGRFSLEDGLSAELYVVLAALERFADGLNDGLTVMDDEGEAASLGANTPRECDEWQGEVDELRSL